MSELNTHLVLICGKAASGKTTSLRNIECPENWLYMGCEAGKDLPIRTKFNKVKITDPYEVISYIDAIAEKDKCKGIIIDSLTFLLQMFESKYVVTQSKADSFKAWSDYGEFIKTLLQDKILKLNKPVIIMAHIQETFNEEFGRYDVSVPIKGSTKNIGIEAFFNLILYAKQVSVNTLKEYSNNMLNITPEEEALGFKYVFQTKLTKNTIGEKIRGPFDLFTRDETFIDNDIQIVLNKLTEYYA